MSDGGSETPAASSGAKINLRWARRFRSIEAAAINGIAFAVLAMLALARFAQYPDLGQSEAELTAWFDDLGNQASLVGALVAASVSAVSFLWFLAVFRRRLGEREDRFFATVFFGSALAYVGVWVVSAAALASPAVVTTTLNGATVGPASASLAAGIGWGLILVVAPRLQAVFVSSMSTVMLRTQAFPKWVAYLGYALSAVLFIMPLVTRPNGLPFPIWILIVSVVILTHRPAPQAEQEIAGNGTD